MMVMNNIQEYTLSLVPLRFLNPWNFLDQFPVDPAIGPINATGHELVTLCRSICGEAGALDLYTLMRNKSIWDMLRSSRSFALFIDFVCSELDAVLHQLGQGVASPGPRGLDTSDTNGDETG